MTATAAAATVVKKLPLRKRFVSSVKSVPGKLKEYLSNVYWDYRTVGVDGFHGAVKNPFKAFVACGGIGIGAYAIRTNPTVIDLQGDLAVRRVELGQLSDQTRNKSSSNYIDQLTILQNQKRLKMWDCLCFSILWRLDHSIETNQYAAVCKQLKPRWRDWPKYVMDVGAFGHWYYIDQAMKDFDINSEEWNSDC